jgi:asparagine synthase (glutamine-hydrolysing)
MCGLVGYVDFQRQTQKDVLSKMTDSLAHRGPDARGELEMDLPTGGRIGLGHRRLSIIDLSEDANQPMTRGTMHIVYNGEIYNYREIKSELEKLGIDFKTESDTEVILAAVARWGIEEAVSRFNGMFAFAIYDEATSELVLVRDRAGIKPLYYYAHDGLLLFASELKAFHQHPLFNKTLSSDAIESFFRYGYVPNSECIFRFAQKILPGHLLRVQLANGKEQSHKYWDIFDSFNQPKLELDLVEAIGELQVLMQSAFDYRMVSDVPVGVFLSGGYDSSLVTAMLQKHSHEKLKTFTIGFEQESFNEAPFAREIARTLGTEHLEYTCTAQDSCKIIPTLAEFYDEPFGDPTAVPTILVSRIARQAVTVALSADAGDELFGGYEKYETALRFLKLDQRIPKGLRNSSLLSLLAEIP